MHNNKGYVVILAIPIQFNAKIEKIVVRNAVYQITISFGNKTIYFNPKDGKSPSSKSLKGVLKLLESRHDIKNLSEVENNFKQQAVSLLKTMRNDGYFVKKIPE